MHNFYAPVLHNLDSVIYVYLSSPPVAHLNDDPPPLPPRPPPPRRRLVVTGIVQGTKLLRIPPGSLTCSAYSIVTPDLGLTSHPKDY